MFKQTWTATAVVLFGLIGAGCDDSRGRSSPAASPAPAPSPAASGDSSNGGAAGVTGGAGGADAVPPWSPPAPAPPAATADLPPAKQAAVKWALALQTGDVAAAKALSIGDAARLKGLERLVAMAVSEKNLERVLKERFGPDEIASLAAAPLPVEIRRSDVKEEGDKVTIWAYINDKPLVLKRQPDGQYKVDLTDIAADTMLASMTTRMNNKMAEEVKAGKYKTSEEAWEAAAAGAGAAADATVEELAAEEAKAGTSAPAAQPATPPAPAAPATDGDGLE
jgi:hypothetical protein